MSHEFPAALRSAAPYINAHRGRVCVVHIPGEVSLGEHTTALVHDLAIAHSLGMSLVLVLGARPQIEERLKQRGINTDMVAGYRVTDSQALDCVKDAAGNLRSEYEALLSTGLANTPMGGAKIQVVSGNLATAKPVGIREGVDLQFTGELRRLDIASLQEHLRHQRIVLMTSLGYSPTGESFNLRSEDLAAQTALALDADKLVMFQEKTVEVGEISLSQPPSRPDAVQQRAMIAVEHGVPRVHIISAADDGAFLRELYTRDGGGLMVSAQDYDALHAASIDDIGGLLNLIEPLERDGIIVPRSREQLELDIEHFAVMARDEEIIGCRAVFPYPEQSCAELACLIVAPEYQHGGRAQALLRSAESKARELGLSRLFVLTTHASHWFVEQGFADGSLDDLPTQKQDFYNYQRNSKVLIKDL